jgi:hypothetical protein
MKKKYRDPSTMKVYNLDQIKILPPREYEIINEKGRVVDYINTGEL